MRDYSNEVYDVAKTNATEPAMAIAYAILHLAEIILHIYNDSKPQD